MRTMIALMIALAVAATSGFAEAQTIKIEAREARG